MTDFNPHDIHRIELEARRMRAEAFCAMFAALGRSISGVFTPRRTGRTA